MGLNKGLLIQFTSNFDTIEINLFSLLGWESKKKQDIKEVCCLGEEEGDVDGSVPEVGHHQDVLSSANRCHQP